MDTSTLLVGGAILLVMLAHVCYILMNASGNDGKAKQTLQTLASQENVSLKHPEVHGNIVVRLNEDSKHLAYSYKSAMASNFTLMDLKTIKSSRVKTTRISEKTLETVTLELAGNGESFELTFYDDHDENSHSLDPQIALQQAKTLDSKVRMLI